MFLLTTKCTSAVGKLLLRVLHNAIANIESPICLNRMTNIFLIGFILTCLDVFYYANIAKKKDLNLNLLEKKQEN